MTRTRPTMADHRDAELLRWFGENPDLVQYVSERAWAVYSTPTSLEPEAVIEGLGEAIRLAMGREERADG